MRKKRQQRTLRTYWGRIKLGLITLTVLGVGGIWWSDYPKQWLKYGLKASAQLGFRLESISVEGRKRTPPHLLLQAIGLSQYDPIFLKSPQEMQSQLEQLPWIHQVTIKRFLPNRLWLQVIERQPIALWQYRHQFYYVDVT